MRKFTLPEEKKIIEYLESITYTGYYKKNVCTVCALDQKCTYDVLNTDCKCILNMIKNKTKFTINDYFNDSYTNNLFLNRTARNGKAKIGPKTMKEYDKIFGNVFEMLSYCEILEKSSTSRAREYSVKNKEIIELLSSSIEACIAFICSHVYQLVKGSLIIISIKNFQNNKNAMNKRKINEQTEL
jgi:hypothetical protein